MAFDPSLILASTRRPETSAGELVRTLSDLASAGTQRRANEAQLGDLLRRQKQEQLLQSIYQQNAATPEQLPEAFLRSGFGAQAFAAQDQAAQMQAARAQAAKASREGQDLQRKLTETERHNRAMEGRPSGIPGLMLIQGEGGAQYFADPRKPAAPAVAITDEAGKQLVKPTGKAGGGKPITKGDRDVLAALSDEQRSFSDLSARFKDAYAGKGVIGNAEVSVAQALGSMGSAGQQDLAQFWADFQSLIDLPQRNKMFGASLTPGEKASWDAAKNIKPGSDPKRVRAQLAKMQGLVTTKLTKRGRSLAKDNYSAESIEEYTGSLGLDDNYSAELDEKPTMNKGADQGMTTAEASELAALEKKYGSTK